MQQSWALAVILKLDIMEIVRFFFHVPLSESDWGVVI